MAAYLLAAAAFDNQRKYCVSSDLSDFELHRRTRLDRYTFRYVLNLLHGDLVRQNGKNYAVPSNTQLLVGLTLLASGSFQWGVGAQYGVSQTTVSVVFERVVLGLVRIAGNYIHFPTTLEQQRLTKQQFYLYGGVRNVLGCIDCTHIAFQPLKGEEAVFVDRKGNHTINVQLTCNAKLMITDVVANWPGSVHDSFIWADCGLRNTVMVMDGWLLGDLGYPMEPWLLTKFRQPATAAQTQYNACVGRTRNLIEIVNGILKSRWRILAKSGGEMLYAAGRVCEITVACCVLHNICTDRNVHLGNIKMVIPPNYPPPPVPAAGGGLGLRQRAVVIRDRLVTMDFA